MESQLTSKLPEELRAKYLKYARKTTPTIEALKIAAALKLWKDRNYRDIKFDVPMTLGGKTDFVKVLAKKPDEIVVGVECASKVRLSWLCEQIAQLHNFLPLDSYIIAVFPSSAGAQAQKVVKFADEVWVTDKNGLIDQMMFASFLL